MSVERYLVTPEGHAKLIARRKELIEVERPQNVRDIEEARAHGDLSENAEYHAAKDRQGFIDLELRTVKDKIARAQVIDPAQMTGDRVAFGATVTFIDLDIDEELTYQLVGGEEADVKAGRVFYKSPLARGLMRKEAGDEVQVKTPNGIRTLEILDVEFI